MKRLYKNTKSRFFVTLIVFLFSSQLWGRSPVAVVNSVIGNAFISQSKTTKKLHKGDHIYDMAEVFTEMGGQVSISDYYDHKFHLSGSGHIAFLNKTLELKRGYLWLQSFNESDKYMVQTANAVSKYKKGEGIISFDGGSGKTQMLAIKGRFEFGNLIQGHPPIAVDGGQFSFVHKEYERGTPRRPTPIGFGSFKKVTGLFNGVYPMGEKPKVKIKKPVAASRGVASMRIDTTVPAAVVMKSLPTGSTSVETPSKVVDGGKIIYIRENKKERQEKKSQLLDYYQSKVKKMTKPVKKVWKHSYGSRSKVKVKVFGVQKKAPRKKASATPHRLKRMPTSTPKPSRQIIKSKKVGRGPASVGGMAPTIHPVKDDFENSLVDQYKKQMRHSNEVNQLIKDLKNYDQDYKTQY
ncbi:MAG: hypothetical protein HN509_14550 [Halobacteriovoraceae bacterium]|jgi:hypothetical protein|nr:hypothetical protein [Halobacteriovoraceae bacterium]MBT5094796.1 hypothetical protein [Halobacteriovoraceae bacterium]